MDGLGFLSLGLSIGMITGLIVSRSRTPNNLGSVFVSLLPLLLSGGAVFLLPQFTTAKSSGLYPVGLLLSMMWLHTGEIIANIDRPKLRALIDATFCIATLIFTAVALFHTWTN